MNGARAAPAQAPADAKRAKVQQRRAHIAWGAGGPRTALLVKKPNSAAASRMLKEIAVWCAAAARWYAGRAVIAGQRLPLTHAIPKPMLAPPLCAGAFINALLHAPMQWVPCLGSLERAQQHFPQGWPQKGACSACNFLRMNASWMPSACPLCAIPGCHVQAGGAGAARPGGAAGRSDRVPGV